jgi:hypothetical protein
MNSIVYMKDPLYVVGELEVSFRLCLVIVEGSEEKEKEAEGKWKGKSLISSQLGIHKIGG